ncbi:pyruvate dehydrogenase (acetyl-transferring), homodimeric type [Fuerstiella marisgermanici]|uniref:Pyruvate dehydrogenase E1 component n=1 Tax=Fuerstiella marisgermanici TaxID=1891926 RepID=A0A1P8WAD6_9PLAN|nr:pyruvate dehydrogenase (acetyl-transferring), homodimeric type [Fuerstiella marisgermanici]APZ91011.1 Pyruvate dehydrogenase E1 component [Fuerstiella marisgermanici]
MVDPAVLETISGIETDELNEWLESLEDVLHRYGPEKLGELLVHLQERAYQRGVKLPFTANTPYINTIHHSEQARFPGDLALERRIKSIVRWNAMAMVVRANKNYEGVGGHISTFASSATLYEVAQNHFFHGKTDDHPGDMVYFQGHASPGMYARAYVEGRLDDSHLENFRRELPAGVGLSSYPHPWLMPNFWQFPTVSMGLGPICSIYHARFLRYMEHRGLKDTSPSRVWAFLGDGECDEPESLGALTLAARENLDNLTWVINCNLQRLDGPVRGNGKIIQELEAAFRGAGWNVIKVIWGGDWDPLLDDDVDGKLVKRMGEVVDGQYQKYTVESGEYIRNHFFGADPDVLKMVDHLSDEVMQKIRRGGHDPEKVYAAYHEAVNHKGAPTVILAKTVKGYGLGEAGEGRNVAHNTKKVNEQELKNFRTRFSIPISDEEVDKVPFYKPADDSPEMVYLRQQREKLGGYVPSRTPTDERLDMPALDHKMFQAKGLLPGSDGDDGSTTAALGQILRGLVRHKGCGDRVVPIIPDEARTFGMEDLFKQVGIYSSKGQLYEPVDRSTMQYYKEAKDGQLLEEGINEAGAMSSFIAAGAAYANLGKNMIPFYVYYSMFGFQRVGDLIWCAADTRVKGFLCGGTSGRTTLNGEGLQHEDGHSQLMATTVPSLRAYDPAYGYELAVIVQEGLRRMYAEGEEIFYYLSVYNENYPQPAMPETSGLNDGIIKGMYKYSSTDSGQGQTHRPQLFGSGPILRSALDAQQMLADKYGIGSDVWSVTSYSELRRDAMACQHYNDLNPGETAKVSYLEKVLDGISGPFISTSDNVRLVADQIREWVPGEYIVLGTDGFGRSETRPELRRHFRIDAESTTYAALQGMSRMGAFDAAKLPGVIAELGLDPNALFPIDA